MASDEDNASIGTRSGREPTHHRRQLARPGFPGLGDLFVLPDCSIGWRPGLRFRGSWDDWRADLSFVLDQPRTLH